MGEGKSGYKIQIKKLVNTEWKPVEMASLEGKSIANFIKESKEVVIACLYQDERPMAFLSNNLDYTEQYKSRGLSLHIDILMELVGSDVSPSILVKTFEGCFLGEICIDIPKPSR